MKRTLIFIIVLFVVGAVLALDARAQRSDLPEGWDDSTQLPPGAVRIEDLKSPYGNVPTHTQVPEAPPPSPAAGMPLDAPAGGSYASPPPSSMYPPPSSGGPTVLPPIIGTGGDAPPEAPVSGYGGPGAAPSAPPPSAPTNGELPSGYTDLPASVRQEAAVSGVVPAAPLPPPVAAPPAALPPAAAPPPAPAADEVEEVTGGEGGAEESSEAPSRFFNR